MPSAADVQAGTGDAAFLTGGGNNAVLMRDADWSKSPLGPMLKKPLPFARLLAVVQEFCTPISTGS